MTINQINYQNMMEKVRSDQAIEAETNRHNIAVEAYNAGLLANDKFKAEEAQRHNKAMEELQLHSNRIAAYSAEIQRLYNEANVRIAGIRATEEQRHNQAQELLTSRQNEWKHEENMLSISKDYEMRQASLLETSRHNIAQEKEAIRSNMENELIKRTQTGESHRHNLVMEWMSGFNTAIDLGSTVANFASKFGAGA